MQHPATLDVAGTVFPFTRGQGKCYLKKEEASAFKPTASAIPSQFDGMDVGIDVDASGLVDVDIDCTEAACFAEWLLPTSATIKRCSKAVSHLLYRCSQDIATAHFHDLDGKEIVALMQKSRLALPAFDTSEWREARVVR